MSYALTALRYLYLLIFFIFLYRLVRWMVGDLKSTGALPGKPAAGRDPGWKLVVLESSVQGFSPGDSYALARSMTFGRGARNDISIADSFTSQFHARIRREGNAVMLEDLGSTNGTFLNSERLENNSALLSEGDKIRIGGVTFQLARWRHEVGTNN